MPTIWDGLAGREIKAAVDDFDASSVDILFSRRAGVDAVAEVAAEGTPIGSCTKEVCLSVSSRKGTGVASGRSVFR